MAAAFALRQAMATVRDTNVDLEPGPVGRVACWNAEQRQAMQTAAAAWLAVVERREQYELASGADWRDWH